jgi:hypothetical protein
MTTLLTEGPAELTLAVQASTGAGSSFQSLFTESLILAQDERWRRA